MPNLTSTFNSIHDFFHPDINEIKPELPSHLYGIWSLKSLNEQGILICLENGDWNQTKRKITIPLYKPGNFLFRHEHLLTQWLCKTFKASFEFTFDEGYTKASIKLKLGFMPIFIPKEVFNWELVCEPENDRMIVRKSKIFGKTYNYISKKIQNESDVVGLGEYENFYYV